MVLVAVAMLVAHGPRTGSAGPAGGLDFLCSSGTPLTDVSATPEVPQVLGGIDYTFKAIFPGSFTGPLAGATTRPDGSRVVERTFPLVTAGTEEFFGIVLGRVFQPYEADLDGDGRRDFWFQVRLKAGTFGLPADLQAQFRGLFHGNFARPRDRVGFLEIDDVLGPLLMITEHAEGWATNAPFRAEVGLGLRFRRADSSLTSTHVRIGVDGTAGGRWPQSAEVALLLRRDSGGDAGTAAPTNYVAVGERFDFGAPAPVPAPAAAASVEVATVTATSPLRTEAAFTASTAWSRAPGAFAFGARQVCPSGPGAASTGHLSWLREPDPDGALDLDVVSGAGRGLRGAPELHLDATVRGIPGRLDWVAHPLRIDVVAGATGTSRRPDVDVRELVLATDDPADPEDSPLRVTGKVAALPGHVRVNGLAPEPPVPGDPFRIEGARIRFCPSLVGTVPPSGAVPHPGDGRVVLPGESEGSVPALRPGCDVAAAPSWASLVVDDFMPADGAAAGLVAPPSAHAPHVLYATRLRRLSPGGGAGGVRRIAAGLANLREVTFRTYSTATDTKLLADLVSTGNPAAHVTIDSDGRTSTSEDLNEGSRFTVDGNLTPLPSRTSLRYERHPREPLLLQFTGPADERPAFAASVGLTEPGLEGGTPASALVVDGAFDVRPPGLPSAWTLAMSDEGAGSATGGRLTWSADARTALRAGLAMSERAERAQGSGRFLHVAADLDRDLTARWSSDAMGLRSVDVRSCRPDVATCAPTPNTVNATYVGARPAPVRGASLDDVPAVPDLPAGAPVPRFTPLDAGGEGVRVVDLTDAKNPDWGYRAQVRNMGRVTWERELVGMDPVGTPARFRRFCAVSEPTGMPFVTNVFLANSQAPHLYLDGVLERLPGVLSAHLRAADDAVDGPPGRRLVWFQTEDCEQAAPPYPLGDEDGPDRPVYTFDLRQGSLGLVAGVARLPYGDTARLGLDADLRLHSDDGTDALDVQGRVRLPRQLDVQVPSLQLCDAAHLTATICPVQVAAYERQERLAGQLAWRSSARSLGHLRAHVVLREPAPTAGDPAHVDETHVDAEVGRVPGTEAVRFDRFTNVRLPWQKWYLTVGHMAGVWGQKTVEPGDALDTVRFALTDMDAPGYKGPWKAPAARTAPEDVANRVPNYQARLRNVGPRLAVTAVLQGSESPAAEGAAYENTSRPPLADPGKEFCRARGGRLRPERQRIGYVDADVDLGGAETLDLRLRNAKERAADPDGASNTVSVESDRPVSGTVAAKVAMSVELAMSVDTFLTTSDFQACLDLDLPVRLQLTNVRRVTLGQTLAGLAVDVPAGDRALGADVNGSLGETFRAPDGSDVARRGAWYRDYYVHFDPEGPGDWFANPWSARDCTFEFGDTVAFLFLGPLYSLYETCDRVDGPLLADDASGLTGWRDVPVHPLKPIPGTVDCDEWPETDQCPLPVGGIDYTRRGWTNEFGFGTRGATTLEVGSESWPSRPAGSSSIAFLVDPLFSWPLLDAIWSRDDADGLPGRPGREIFEVLRKWSDPPSHFDTPDLETLSSRIGVTDWQGRFVQATCRDGRPREADTMTAGDGTTYEVLFQDATCDETSWPTSPWAAWDMEVKMFLVARHPNGAIRWSRDLTEGGWRSSETIWGVGRPLPEESIAAVDLLLGDDGSVQANVWWDAGDEGDAMSQVLRFDPSGHGGKASHLMRVGLRELRSCSPATPPVCVSYMLPGVVDGATEWNVPAGSPRSSVVWPGFGPCGPGCAGRTLFFGDGTQQRFGLTEPVPSPPPFHTYPAPGRYPLMVVSYRSDGSVLGVHYAGRVTA